MRRSRIDSATTHSLCCSGCYSNSLRHSRHDRTPTQIFHPSSLVLSSFSSPTSHQRTPSCSNNHRSERERGGDGELHLLSSGGGRRGGSPSASSPFSPLLESLSGRKEHTHLPPLLSRQVYEDEHTLAFLGTLFSRCKVSSRSPLTLFFSWLFFRHTPHPTRTPPRPPQTTLRASVSLRLCPCAPKE